MPSLNAISVSHLKTCSQLRFLLRSFGVPRKLADVGIPLCKPLRNNTLHRIHMEERRLCLGIPCVRIVAALAEPLLHGVREDEGVEQRLGDCVERLALLVASSSWRAYFSSPSMRGDLWACASLAAARWQAVEGAKGEARGVSGRRWGKVRQGRAKGKGPSCV